MSAADSSGDERVRDEGPGRDGPVTDADVVVVGAGPTGLMLAGELCLAGVRPLVLERRPRRCDTPRAYGVNGQILQLVLNRIAADAAADAVQPAPRIPFGGVHLDSAHLPDSPLRVLRLPQPRLEDLLAARARQLGAVVRRGRRVVAVGQDDAAVTAEIRGPRGPYRVRARYLVGCDGAHSRVREEAGIEFPGTTYPEVNRLGQVALPDTVTRLEDGRLDVPGLGRIGDGFIRTERGVFALGFRGSGDLLVQTTEDEPAEADDGTPMTPAELRDSVRRVLGADFPLGEPRRLSRYRFHARQAQRYRDGRILLAGDAAHQFPATGAGLNTGMADAANLAWKLAAAVHGWAPAGLLDTYDGERRFAGARTMLQTQAQVALRRGQDAAAEALREVFSHLCADEGPLRRLAHLVAGTDIRYPLPGSAQHALAGTFAPDLVLRTGRVTTSVGALLRPARPLLLDLADRQDLREAARGSRRRVEVRTAATDRRPADALLIRPDAHIAWAADVGEPAGTAVPALREALRHWFGAPRQDAAAGG